MIGSASAVNRSLLEEHFEEVVFLWGQWNRARRLALFALHDLRALEERIESHALALGADSSAFLRDRLHSRDVAEVWGAAWLLLRLKEAGIGLLLLNRLQDPALSPTHLAAVVNALALAGNATSISAVLQLKAADATFQAYQLELAALHQPGELSRVALEKLLRHAAPEVRERAWRCASMCNMAPPPELTLAGALDESAAVRAFAMQTAAWAGQAWVLDHCRRAAAKPSLEHHAELCLLAALATQADGPLVLGLVAKAELGAFRFQLLGSYAQVEAVPLLLHGMTHPDPASAAAAGAAFTRITGRVLRTMSKVTLPPKDGSAPDDFEKEFLEEVNLPDAKEAADHWAANQGKFQPGQRYSQGLPVPLAPPFVAALDIVSIREACLRAAFEKKPTPRAMDFEHFPVSQLSTILNLKQ